MISPADGLPGWQSPARDHQGSESCDFKDSVVWSDLSFEKSPTSLSQKD